MRKQKMSTIEMDPLFVKALRLLHSKAKDSADQLKQLLDDALLQKPLSVTTSKDSKQPFRQEENLKAPVGRKISPKHATETASQKVPVTEESRRREGEKRTFEKPRLEIQDFTLENKRARVESPHSATPSPQSVKTEESGSRKTDESDSSEGNTDADDFALEMGLACVVCKQIDVSPGNQLVECQECHSLYHQECHRPSVTDFDMNDPRRVWYCTRCTKTMKKMTIKSKKSNKPVITGTSKDATPSFKNKGDTLGTTTLQPFKRSEIKVPLTQTSVTTVTTNKPVGLAGLAANLNARPAVSSSPSSSFPSKLIFSTNRTPGPSTPVVTKPSFTSIAPSSKGLVSCGAQTKVTPTSSSVSVGSQATTLAGSKISVNSSSIGVTVSGGNKTGGGLLNAVSSSLVTRNSNPATSSNGSNSSNIGGAKPVSSSSLMSADKRLQIMKKKAAAKMQEKRRLSTK
ncbi:integrator complex subunit 12 isoform X2 [Tachypleus tridentatus]|uniref:integrator complex subunit 12 isoform X2 n=1 Tax=Tachypleus tridentatus TaxID=6853 RepID=UPI003FD5A8C5